MRALALTASHRSQTPIGGAYVHDSATLTGANVWLLEYIADKGGMIITYETVFLTDALFYSNNRTAQMEFLFDLGYDCMFSATVLRGERLAHAEFLVANEQSGLSVVVPMDQTADYPVKSMLFAWTEPFSYQIWITVFFSLIFSAMVMFLFEGEDTGEDYGSASLPLPLRLARGCYKAFLNFSSVGGFSPTTPAGQMFNITFSFAMLLLQAAYTANLAAYFTQTQQIQSAVDEMSDFGGNQLSACITNDPFVLQLLQSAFPLTQFVVLPSALTSDLLDAIQAGQCAGGVAPDSALLYALGPADPFGNYCNMMLKGGLMSQVYYSIPFNRQSLVIDQHVVDAMNALASDAFAYGEYAVGASMASFPAERPACQGYNSGPPSGSLTALRINQVSGIFFLLLFGTICALMLYAAFVIKGLGKVKGEKGTQLEEALKTRQQAEFAALKAAEASGEVSGSGSRAAGAPMRASSAAWLARIRGGGAIGMLSPQGSFAADSGNGGLGTPRSLNGPSPGGDYSRMGAIEALAASLAREAAAVMDVPARTSAAVERAVGERGAYIVASLRLCDAQGNAYGPEIPAGPITRASDWQFLYTRLEPDDAAAFNRQLRALVGGHPPHDEREKPPPLPPPRLPPRREPSWGGSSVGLGARSAGGLQQVVVHGSGHGLGRYSATDAERARRRAGSGGGSGAGTPVAAAPARPFAFPSMKAITTLFGRAPEPPAAAPPRRRRRVVSVGAEVRGTESGERREGRAGGGGGADPRQGRSEPPRGRHRIPDFDGM